LEERERRRYCRHALAWYTLSKTINNSEKPKYSYCMDEPPRSRIDEDVEKKLPAWARILLRLMREARENKAEESDSNSQD